MERWGQRQGGERCQREREGVEQEGGREGDRGKAETVARKPEGDRGGREGWAPAGSEGSGAPESHTGVLSRLALGLSGW